MTDTAHDPFASAEKLPSVSFEPENGGHSQGEKVVIRVLDDARMVEDRDDDGNVKTFKNGDPMHKIVMRVEEKQADGTWVKKGFWFPCVRKDGSLFMAFGKMQREAREKHGKKDLIVSQGFLVELEWAGLDLKPKEDDPKKSGRKLFVIHRWKYEPPKDAAEDDPFSATAATAESAAPANTPAAAEEKKAKPAATPAAGPANTSLPDDGGDAW